MTQGELVRLIDIPVPKRDEGGIFDRVKASGRRQVIAHRSARRLRRSLRRTYGTLFPAWIAYLQGGDRTSTLRALQGAFVRKVCPDGDALEMRLAQKFGLLAAAGELAITAGLLDWPKGWAKSTLRTAYRQHKSTTVTASDRAEALLRQIARESADPDRFQPVGPKQDARFGAHTIGLRTKYRGEEVLAFPDGALNMLQGDAGTSRAFEALLDKHRLLRRAPDGKRTRQLRHPYERNGKRLQKPRYLLVGLAALKQWATS